MPAADSARRLAGLERWFQAQVVVPHERGSGAARELAPAARAVVLPSHSLTPGQRLAIYSGMYLSRLNDCLREDFAAVAAVLGEPAFSRLVRTYLRRHPSRHYSLTALGQHLPRFLAGPAAVPRKALVTDLARLELAMTEVFHAPPAQALTREQLAAVPAASWPAARLRPIPALDVLAFDHDANAIVTAVRMERPLPPLRRRRSFVAVWRRDHVVWRQDLDEPRHALLAALAAGRTVGKALAAAARCWHGDPAELPQQVFGWFAHWTAEGMFAAVELPAAGRVRRGARAARGVPGTRASAKVARRAPAARTRRQPAARRA